MDVPVEQIICVIESLIQGYVNLAKDYGWQTVSRSARVREGKEMIEKLKAEQIAGQKGLFESCG